MNNESTIIWFSSYQEPRVSTRNSNASESSGSGTGGRLCRPLNQTRKQDMILLKISLEHSKGNNCTVRGSSIWEAYARGFTQLLNKALLGFLDKI